MTAKFSEGFTLVELLVVIAIISIVAAMLFPVFASVREKARAIACLNNCKQLGMAEMQYVQDNDETFWNQPDDADRGPFYSDLLMPYLKSTGVFRCPDNTINTTAADGFWPDLHDPLTYPVDYGFANRGIHSHEDYVTVRTLAPYKLSQIDNTANIVLLTDASIYWIDTVCVPDPDKPAGKGSYYFFQGDPSGKFYFMPYIGQPIHQGGMNFVYADGHAKMGRVVGVGPDSQAQGYAGYYPTARALDDDCGPPFGILQP